MLALAYIEAIHTCSDLSGRGSFPSISSVTALRANTRDVPNTHHAARDGADLCICQIRPDVDF